MGYKRSDALPNAHKPTRPSNQGDPLRDLAGSLQETKHVYQSGVFEWVCALLMWAIIWVALLLIIGYATSPARADECDLAQTTRAMAECYGAVAKQSEKVMQSKFEQRLQRTPAYLRKALVTAQKQWIGLRDYQCKRDLAGSIAPVSFAICIAEENRKRTAEIEKGGKG